ncbi:uncharacterized protein LOC144643868 [Oculina patagonica]
MKLCLSLLVVLLMADACWSQCSNKNWWGSFDHQGWSTCDSKYEYITGLYRNDPTGSDPIYLLEEARCCFQDRESTCMNANWWGALDRKNSWAVCPDGYFLQGLYRTAGHNLYNIEEGRCCKPNNLPKMYGHCYNHNVWGSFDRKGWSICNDGYYLTGIYKGICDKLYCLEWFKCCTMKVV